LSIAAIFWPTGVLAGLSLGHAWVLGMSVWKKTEPGQKVLDWIKIRTPIFDRCLSTPCDTEYANFGDDG
jgi:hypothetical protein